MPVDEVVELGAVQLANRHEVRDAQRATVAGRGVVADERVLVDVGRERVEASVEHAVAGIHGDGRALRARIDRVVGGDVAGDQPPQRGRAPGRELRELLELGQAPGDIERPAQRCVVQVLHHPLPVPPERRLGICHRAKTRTRATT